MEAAECAEKAHTIYHKLRNSKSAACLVTAAKCMRSANRMEGSGALCHELIRRIR